MEEQGPQQAGCLHPIYPRPGDQGQHTIALALGAAENPHAPDHVDLRLLQARPPNPLGVSESWTSRLRQHLAQLPASVVQGSDYSRRTEGSALQVARKGDRGRARTRYRNSDGKGGTQLPQEREVRPGHLSAGSHDQRDQLAGGGFVGRDENPSPEETFHLGTTDLLVVLGRPPRASRLESG